MNDFYSPKVLKYQWANGLGYDPAHNPKMSNWSRSLWCGNYDEVMKFLNGKSPNAIKHQIERRESPLNANAIFHVVIGARSCNSSHDILKVKNSCHIYKKSQKFIGI